ncbi:uncharacterized protein (DUF1697 family) [Pseudochelatococcus lubricantis]|uniref:Uncharacterized protein (DUF1697 family) n=1 Tax=Pseudochelatococcus lubricantis TaxID=1538102 RepID=A0ABX0V2P2_9HYPH|nr:DUF1697 domain-containing protein [Pseudochelatococcus lubricantis]NIJ59493.1 uncharacterized protein (DUF1697 family) [Pseudochelatococcus lubricantis]
MNRETVFIVLFRGIGGKTQLPVKPLREKLTDAGFRHVVTYINSGNAVFGSVLSRDAVVATVAEVCAQEFNFDKPIYALTRSEWDDLIARNPFPDAVDVPKHLHAAVLAAQPAEAVVETLRTFASEGERIAVVDNVAYLHTPGGFGRSRLAEKFDRGIGVPNTARNWNTVLKLAELACEVARG